MKKQLMAAIAMFSIAMPAMAGPRANKVEPATRATLQQNMPQDVVMQKVAWLQTGWAQAIYRSSRKAAKLGALHKLERQAAKLAAAHRARAEPKIWQAIILSTDAGISGGFSALGKVKKARQLLLSSIRIDPRALKGSALTSLGSLYYQVPGWPIGFGDNALAEKYLKRALRINPHGIDANYFYGDYLLQRGRKREAKNYLRRALNAPSRPNRPVADAGRRREIKTKLRQLR